MTPSIRIEPNVTQIVWPPGSSGIGRLPPFPVFTADQAGPASRFKEPMPGNPVIVETPGGTGSTYRHLALQQH